MFHVELTGGSMKVELTTEQADLLLLELESLIQGSRHPRETIEQMMAIRQNIARAIIEDEGVNYG